VSNELPALDDSRILIYRSDSGETRLEVRLQEETVWLTQNLMAELYQTTKQNISLHIQNIFEEGELAPEATVKKYLTVRREGSRQVRRQLDFYNLDVIIAVGYRVTSAVATRFRQWATARLSEYIVKGFTLDDERLKGGAGLADYFEREVRPHVPDAWINETVRDEKDGQVGRVGYEIPLTRHFYRYTPPWPLAEIEADIKAIEKDIVRMLVEVTQ
jgi:hypothetical protein